MNKGSCNIDRTTFILVIIISLISSVEVFGQNVDDYKWKNRIILIISNNEDSEIFKKQINALEKDLQELEECKLILFKITPSKYQLNSDKWETNSELYTTYNLNNEPFKIVLIGLDGGIKLNQNTYTPKRDLFALIDGMPMRRVELKNKKASQK